MPARSLLRWVTGICLIGALVNAGLILPRTIADMRRLAQVWKRDALWRGLMFHRGERMADYLNFVRQSLPPNAEIILPDIANVSADKMLSTPALQFYLLPWRVRNCLNVACLKQGEASSIILYTTKAEQRLLAEFPGRLKPFDSGWGIYLPPTANTDAVPETAPQGEKPLWLEAVGGLALLGCLNLAGFLFCRRLEMTFQEKFALGYGLGLCGFSLLNALGWLLGSQFAPPTMIAGAGFLLLCGFFSGRASTSGRAADVSFNGWHFTYLAMAALSVFLAVGKGYSVSDEIQLWGLKGYGIALDRSLAAVTQWGTNTTAYPLHIPVLIGSFKALFGDALPASKFIFSGYYVCLLFYLDGMLSRFALKGNVRALAVLTLGGAPILFRHSTLAYTNLAFTVYLIFGADVFFRLVQHQALLRNPTQVAEQKVESGWQRGLIPAFLLCAALWTRPEGVYFVGLILLCSLWVGVREIIHRQPEEGKGNRIRQSFLPEESLGVFGLVFGLYALFWHLLKQQIYPQPLRTESITGLAIRGIVDGEFHLAELGYVMRSMVVHTLTPEIWGGVGFGMILLGGMLMWRAGLKGRTFNPMLVSGVFMTAVILVLYYTLTFDAVHDIRWWINTSLDRLWMPALAFFWIGCWQHIGWLSQGDQGSSFPYLR